MRRWGIAIVVVALLALAGGASAMPKAVAHGRGVSDAALAAAGRQAHMRDIDYDEIHCDGDWTVAAWLRWLTGPNARAITWTGGPCELNNAANPIDSGSRWCAQANIALAHPADRHDAVMIEVYFNRPVRGRLAPPYAFRAVMPTADGPDYVRFRKDFEAEWGERFGPPEPTCPDP